MGRAHQYCGNEGYVACSDNSPGQADRPRHHYDVGQLSCGGICQQAAEDLI